MSTDHTQCILDCCWICRGECSWAEAEVFKPEYAKDTWAHRITLNDASGSTFCHASRIRERIYREGAQ